MTVAKLIYESANRFSLDINSDENLKDREHKRICSILVRLQRKYPNISMFYLLYLGVGTSAYKTSMYQKGYTRINTRKIEGVIKLVEIINKRLNNNRKVKKDYINNQGLMIALSRYYDLTFGDEKKLKKVLTNEKIKELRNELDSKTTKTTAKHIGEILFADIAIFNENNNAKTYIKKISI